MKAKKTPKVIMTEGVFLLLYKRFKTVSLQDINAKQINKQAFNEKLIYQQTRIFLYLFKFLQKKSRPKATFIILLLYL